MLGTIKLNDNLRFQARKIHNETSDRHLSPEPHAAKLFAAQMLPQVALGVGRLVAQRARALLQFGVTHAGARIAFSPPPP